MKKADRKRLIRSYYAARAKDYDKQKTRTWKSRLGFGDEVTDEILNAFSSFEGKLLLEVGVGSGRNALPLLNKVGLKLVGLDLSEEMLEQAKTKLSSFEEGLDLVLGDAENLPFRKGAFDGLLCMSTMHYFERPRVILQAFLDTMKKDGIFVYGDLTLHEMDDASFLEKLERTVSKAHAKYAKPSEIAGLIECLGYRVARMKTVVYTKSYRSLVEDKGKYFGVSPEKLHDFLAKTSQKARELYSLKQTEMTLFYTVIRAQKQE